MAEELDVKSNMQPPLLFVMQLLAVGCARYIRSCAKNVIKMSIGRKPYFTPRDIFFRAYLLHLLRVKPMRSLTCCCSRGEGVGSHALMIMGTIEFASRCNLMYVHTPFSEIAHADRPMDKYAAAWETFFSFGLGEARSGDDDDRDVVNFAFNFTDLMRCFGLDEIVPRQVLPALKQKYRANKLPIQMAEPLIIGVHVRRGDVHEGHPMWTDNRVVARIVANVKRLLDARSLQHRVMVFSQGHLPDLSDLIALGVDFHLDTDPIGAMRNLVDADILITAKSSFSYVAGLLSDGIIFTESVGHRRLDSWLQFNSNGDFDEVLFCVQLERRLRARYAPSEEIVRTVA